VRPLVRPAAEDLFRLGTAEAMQYAVRGRLEAVEFTADPVDPDAVRDAVDSAGTAPTWASPGWSFDVLAGAPVQVVPRVSSVDSRTLLALGAAVQNILVTASAHGLATRWDPPTDDLAAGTVHIGHPR